MTAGRYTVRMQTSSRGIALVGFDADDTLWRSQDYFDDAQAQFERIVGAYVDLDDAGARLYAVEKRNIALFGYGVKGMVLSMIESAVEITESRIGAAARACRDDELHRPIGLPFSRGYRTGGQSREGRSNGGSDGEFLELALHFVSSKDL